MKKKEYLLSEAKTIQSGGYATQVRCFSPVAADSPLAVLFKSYIGICNSSEGILKNFAVSIQGGAENRGRTMKTLYDAITAILGKRDVRLHVCFMRIYTNNHMNRCYLK